MSLEVEVTRDPCILLKDTGMWWDRQDKRWSCRTDMPACFLFKAGKTMLCFHSNQLNKTKRKRRGRKKCSWWSTWQVVKSCKELPVPSSCIQRKPIAASVKRFCHAPDGILQPHISETVRKKVAFFCRVVVTCWRGQAIGKACCDV